MHRDVCASRTHDLKAENLATKQSALFVELDSATVCDRLRPVDTRRHSFSFSTSLKYGALGFMLA